LGSGQFGGGDQIGIDRDAVERPARIGKEAQARELAAREFRMLRRVGEILFRLEIDFPERIPCILEHRRIEKSLDDREALVPNLCEILSATRMVKSLCGVLPRRARPRVASSFRSLYDPRPFTRPRTYLRGRQELGDERWAGAARSSQLAGFGLDQLRGDAIAGFAQAAFNPLLSQAIFRDSQCKRVDAVQ